ncbi:glycosyltransferase family 2 protein [Cellulomonas iranensis]|uniref:glycosyltransferase family 2 protein n=1 Tax=Cellulomonas iranensis TaxID=76862 RepID=UPI003D7C6538
MVPVYGVERYLRKCLDSLLAQTLDGLEIVTVNDASPDGSLAILREYEAAHPGRVIVLDSPTNRRQGGARNLGIEAARGEFLGFVDSDDWVNPTMYEKLYGVAVATGADVVDCDLSRTFGDPPRLLREVSCTQAQTGKRTAVRDVALIRRGSRIVTKIVRRRLFVDHDIRFPEGVAYEDNALSTMWCLADRIEKVNEALYFYRFNPGSTVRSGDPRSIDDRLLTAELMQSNAHAWGLTERHKQDVDARFVQLYYLNTIGPCLFRFDRPQRERLTALRATMRARHPRYRRDPGFRDERAVVRVASWLNDLSPTLLCALALAVRAVGRLAPRPTARGG